MGTTAVKRMTSKTLTALLAALCSAVVLTAPAPAAAARTAPPQLAGVTRIVGDTTSAMWVTVPHKASFTWKLDENPDVRIDGGGRMAGVVITEGDFGDRGRLFAMMGRASFCRARGCTSEDTHQFLTGQNPHQAPSDKFVLPAGRYLLYLIADGAPASVTLRLHGLPGKARIVPRTPVDAEVHVPTPQTEVMGPDEKVYWFGDAGTIDADAGLIAGAMSLDTKNWSRGSWGSCLQRVVLEPEPVGYSPACPAGASARTTVGSPVPGDQHIHDTSIWNVAPGGRWGLGMNYVAVADVQSVAAVTLYLPYQVPPA
ncbi:MAG TPA: hypothetical protein VEU29_03585 [Actinomycetota bacterium]|nr:hypothetical protein [Actinomycetota bacterium]